MSVDTREHLGNTVGFWGSLGLSQNQQATFIIPVGPFPLWLSHDLRGQGPF